MCGSQRNPSESISDERGSQWCEDPRDQQQAVDPQDAPAKRRGCQGIMHGALQQVDAGDGAGMQPCRALAPIIAEIATTDQSS